MEVLTSDDQVVTVSEALRETYDYFDLANEMGAMTLDSERVKLPITYEEWLALVELHELVYSSKGDTESYTPPLMSRMRRVMALMSPKDEMWRLGVVLDDEKDEDYWQLGIVVVGMMEANMSTHRDLSDEEGFGSHSFDGLVERVTQTMANLDPERRRALALRIIQVIEGTEVEIDEPEPSPSKSPSSLVRLLPWVAPQDPLNLRGYHVHDDLYIGHIHRHPVYQEVLPHLHYIAGAIHSGYLSALLAGDYSDEAEIPWYHINWRVISHTSSEVYNMLQNRGRTLTDDRSFLADALAGNVYPREYYMRRAMPIRIQYRGGVPLFEEIPHLDGLLERLIPAMQVIVDPMLRPTYYGLAEVLGYEDIMQTQHSDFLTKRELNAYHNRRDRMAAESLIGHMVSWIIRSHHEDYPERLLERFGGKLFVNLIGACYQWSRVLLHRAFVEESIGVDHCDLDEVALLREDAKKPLNIAELVVTEPYDLYSPTAEEEEEFAQRYQEREEGEEEEWQVDESEEYRAAMAFVERGLALVE
jgi:hypothetical protein